MFLKKFILFFVTGIILLTAVFNDPAGASQTTGSSDNPEDQVIVAGGQIRAFQKGQILWAFKITRLSLKETPDVVYLPEISDGTFYNPETKKPLIEKIEARQASVHTKTSQFQAGQLSGLISITDRQTVKITGNDYTYNPDNHLGFIKGDCYLEFRKNKIKTSAVVFDQRNNQINSFEKLIFTGSGFQLEATGFNFDLKLQKIFLLKNIKITSANYFSLTGEQAEFNLKSDKLLISSAQKIPVVANYFKNGTSVNIEAPQSEVDFKKETISFGTPGHLHTEKSRASANSIIYFKKENIFKLSGRVTIERNKNEQITCTEALWLPEKKSFKFKGRIKTRIRFEKNLTLQTLF